MLVVCNGRTLPSEQPQLHQGRDLSSHIDMPRQFQGQVRSLDDLNLVELTAVTRGAARQDDHTSSRVVAASSSSSYFSSVQGDVGGERPL
eukprot:3754292-Pyramimonas_sp.AAC.1